MTEAVQTFIQHLFNNGFTKIYAGYFKGNESSKRVMEKCCMKYDNTIEKELVYNGEEKDVIYYLITKSK